MNKSQTLRFTFVSHELIVFVGHYIDFYKEKKRKQNKFGKNKEHSFAQTRALSKGYAAQILKIFSNLTKLIGRAWV